MNYINKGKRDILIIPKFKNIEILQKIRIKYDELAKILPPHITIVYPFADEISNKKLQELLENNLKGFNRFKIKCEGISFNFDDRIKKYYIFLNITEGSNKIIELHNKIYDRILPNVKGRNYDFIPHITLGSVSKKEKRQLESINNEFCVNEKFETVIDSLIVESIGDNESSNIEFKVNLSKI